MFDQPMRRPLNKDNKKRRPSLRQKGPAKKQSLKGVEINYKNLPLLQRFLNERGRIIPRRLSGLSASDQRQVVESIKQARFLALLPTGGV